ncbi:MAG: manganese/iron transport system ATP-binding protein [Candidatus Tokpelaia sp. JSC161]|jgi:manganese/iron transport system ATP-binding protein|nr:MAG: manganese/iron transport system ATP-binding protein [Candidatus Tokpelaia sp. JSC161]
MQANIEENNSILVNNASVTYRNGHTALKNVTFRIPQKSISALIGINGSGKSTLFKVIMGFIPLKTGKITILGKSIKTALHKKLIAYVPQAEEVDWSFPLLVEDLIMMGRYGHMGIMRIPRFQDHQAVKAALSRIHMTHLRKRQIGELSGGQKKRIFLARALVQNSPIILLDEPFTGIDLKTENQIISLLRELRDEGKIIIVSTHNLFSIPTFCDQSILLKETILAYGSTKKIFTQENLEKTFGGTLPYFGTSQNNQNIVSSH